LVYLFVCFFVACAFDLKGRDILSLAAAAASAAATAASPVSPNDLGLRPHEIRDLIRRGLWPKPHGADEDRGTSACVSAALFNVLASWNRFSRLSSLLCVVGRIFVEFRNFVSHVDHFWTGIHQKFALIRRDSTGVLWRMKIDRLLE
jgi:hypothetical protein